MYENWRRVWIMGTVEEEHLPNLEAVVTPRTPAGVHPFAFVGAQPNGLNVWPAPRMDVVGELAVPNVDNATLRLWAMSMIVTVPSLLLVIHVGSDHRSDICEATISVRPEAVTIAPACVTRLRFVPEEERSERVARALMFELGVG